MAHNFTESPASGGLRPSKPVASAALADHIPHAATPNFYLKFHPLKWRCVDGEWLPILNSLRIDLGANGVDKMGNIDEALLMSDKRGYKVLAQNLTENGESYVDVWPCASGDYHCTIWETPKWVGTRVLASETDTEGYNAWLRWLVAEGHVGEPDPSILDQIQIEQQRKRVESLQKDPNPSVAPILAEQKAVLAVQVEAAEELKKPRAQRKPRKSRAKKATT